jgi:membrane-bound ClpP family serine protease
MNLLTNLKKPIWLFVIGMIIILLTVLLKTMGILQMLQIPFFIIGLFIELMAVVMFFKKGHN